MIIRIEKSIGGMWLSLMVESWVLQGETSANLRRSCGYGYDDRYRDKRNECINNRSNQKQEQVCIFVNATVPSKPFLNGYR
jgi:hypothetical protein